MTKSHKTKTQEKSQVQAMRAKLRFVIFTVEIESVMPLLEAMIDDPATKAVLP